MAKLQSEIVVTYNMIPGTTVLHVRDYPLRMRTLRITNIEWAGKLAVLTRASNFINYIIFTQHTLFGRDISLVRLLLVQLYNKFSIVADFLHLHMLFFISK